MFKIYDGRKEFYQWDLDQKLIVSDPTINEVHFCNMTGDCSLVCKVYDEGEQRLVNVPNILLQKSYPIKAYAHCDCATKASQTFNVIPRSRPTDYVYTEKEKYTLEALIEEAMEEILNKGIETVNADYEDNDPESKAHILNRPFYDTRVIDENGEETGELKTLEDKYLDLENRAKMQEVESIAKGANQALSFGDYVTMIDVFNDLPKDKYKVGQNVYIVTLGVPDLWISEIKDTTNKYDSELEGGYNTFQSVIEANGSYQVGYYVFSRLETQKVDLTNYVKNTDYAVSGEKHGLIKLTYADQSGLRATTQGLRIYASEETQIKGKANEFRPIVPKYLDLAIKYGLAYNRLTLTDEEKASALAWLGVSYANLPDKPFGGNEPIDINYTTSKGTSNLNDGVAYFQTEKTYSVDELIGATVEYRDGSSISDTTTLSRSHIREESEDGVRLLVGNCNIYVAYTTNYKPANSGKPFSRTGVYFSFYDDGDPYYVCSLIKEGEDIIYLDNKYLDLANHPVIKDILSRL